LILDILRNVPKLLCENTGRTGAMHLYAASMSGLWTHLERQKEESGCVDQETEIETDRRIVRDRIAF
jgi:GTP-binding protein HflX